MHSFINSFCFDINAVFKWQPEAICWVLFVWSYNDWSDQRASRRSAVRIFLDIYVQLFTTEQLSGDHGVISIHQQMRNTILVSLERLSEVPLHGHC
jgi:hypothetical protein